MKWLQQKIDQTLNSETYQCERVGFGAYVCHVWKYWAFNNWSPVCANVLSLSRYKPRDIDTIRALITRFVEPTCGPRGADRTQVGPMLVPWTCYLGESCSHLEYMVMIYMSMTDDNVYFTTRHASYFQLFRNGLNRLHIYNLIAKWRLHKVYSLNCLKKNFLVNEPFDNLIHVTSPFALKCIRGIGSLLRK